MCGVVGVFGLSLDGNRVVNGGRVLDRERMLETETALPSRVDTLDELLVAVPQKTSLGFDPRLGFHLYAADLCVFARQQGLSVVAIDAPCFHNSSLTELPVSLRRSARVFSEKWARQMPIITTCVSFREDGEVVLASQRPKQRVD